MVQRQEVGLEQLVPHPLGRREELEAEAQLEGEAVGEIGGGEVPEGIGVEGAAVGREELEAVESGGVAELLGVEAAPGALGALRVGLQGALDQGALLAQLAAGALLEAALEQGVKDPAAGEQQQDEEQREHRHQTGDPVDSLAEHEGSVAGHPETVNE